MENEIEYILVSSCLLGELVRWHGRKSNIPKIVKNLLNKQNNKINLFNEQNNIKIISACPEILGGLSVPRSPVKRIGNRVYETCSDKKNRKFVTGKEVTNYFLKGAEETLKLCLQYNIKKAILCKWSPSCDITGITGKLLTLNGIKIINTF